ncbi:MAG: decarboxylase [Geminicoccaceae bacterium]|jgi:2-oxo-4-hydroxy-4-carboxy-5-ureidoimidazoline decarboxylase|nr:decarboxylase [Geminicoccaceae bacterium]
MTDPDAAVAAFDALLPHEAAPMLQTCCGSTAWVNGMLVRRPFTTLHVLLRDAEQLWWDLTPDDWREAFDHHPRIGETVAAVAQGDASRKWSTSEQSGASSAADDTRRLLAEGNREYERRFGHIYLLCATGMTGDEMLASLRERMRNDPATELRVAAGEQAKITRLRLLKMFGGDPSTLSAE